MPSAIPHMADRNILCIGTFQNKPRKSAYPTIIKPRHFFGIELKFLLRGSGLLRPSYVWQEAVKQKRSLLTPFARHGKEACGEDDFKAKWAVATWKWNRSPRTLEAFWVREFNSTTSNRSECIPIISEFLPFIPLGGFWNILCIPCV